MRFMELQMSTMVLRFSLPAICNRFSVELGYLTRSIHFPMLPLVLLFEDASMRRTRD